MKQLLTAEQLKAALDADEQENPEDKLAIFALIHEERRKRAHARAKLTQPELGLDAIIAEAGGKLRGAKKPRPGEVAEAAPAEPASNPLLAKLTAYAFAPQTKDDLDFTGMQYRLEIVRDCFAEGNFEDAVYALARVFRMCVAGNAQMGAIEKLLPVADSKEEKGEL